MEETGEFSLEDHNRMFEKKKPKSICGKKEDHYKLFIADILNEEENQSYPSKKNIATLKKHLEQMEKLK